MKYDTPVLSEMLREKAARINCNDAGQAFLLK